MIRRKLAARRNAAGRPSSSSDQPSQPSDAREAVRIDLSPLSGNGVPFSRISLALLSFVVLHIAGLFLFSSGFLLTRLELDTRNNCTSFRAPEGRSPGENDLGAGCWHPRRYDRAVLIMIDALRYDFTVFNETLEEEARRTGDNSSIPYYINKLPTIRNILESQPSHGLLFQVRADPPTTTLQRLKAITTGTLPTFVDAGSNFFGQMVGEDNIIDQLIRHGKRVTFMGDDTWENMYPHSMNESHPYPSLDVWDLHTVDNGVLEHLYPALERSPKDWDFLIAHFLGVDHAGHRYGPEHPAMAAKLTQMDGVLQRVFDLVEDDTIVFVMGDHGMDPKGDHGGDSENELNAGMFVYSKRPLLDTDAATAQLLERTLAELTKVDIGSVEPYPFLDSHRTTPQIDFVPTFTALLGLPTPFVNLGTLIPELFLVPNGATAGDASSKMRNLLDVTRINAWQINNYLIEYSRQRMAAKLSIYELGDLFQEAEAHYVKLDDGAEDVQQLLDVYLRYVTFTRRALIAARRIWARFDVPLIVMGSIVLSLAVLSLAVYRMVNWSRNLPVSRFALLAGGLVGIGASTTGTVRRAVRAVDRTGDSAMTVVHEAVFSILVGMVLAYLLSAVVQLFISRRTTVSTAKWVSPSTLLGLLLFVLNIIIPASDSFTVNEDSITVYLLQAFGLFNFTRALGLRNQKAREGLTMHGLLFMILTRISQMSVICREDQHPYCIPTFNATPTTSVAAPETLVILVLLIPIVALCGRSLLKGSDNYENTGFVLPAIFLPIAMVLSAGYWILDTIDSSEATTVEWAARFKLYWAKIGVLTAFGCCLFIWASDPNCVGLDVVDVKGEAGDGGPKKRLLINGLANAIGASYFVFVWIAYVVLAMVQKPMGGVMMAVGFLQLFCLLEMMHLWRDHAVKGGPTPTKKTHPGPAGIGV
ncbi:mannose-ethanolamine phosphotransferase gpi13, partial [Borealophlyctis nickersoniae]